MQQAFHACLGGDWSPTCAAISQHSSCGVDLFPPEEKHITHNILVQMTFTQPPSPQHMDLEGSHVPSPRPVRTRQVSTNHRNRSGGSRSFTDIPGVYSYSLRTGVRYDVPPDDSDAPGALRMPATLLPPRMSEGNGQSQPGKMLGTFPGATASRRESVQSWVGQDGESEQPVGTTGSAPGSHNPTSPTSLMQSQASFRGSGSGHRHMYRQHNPSQHYDTETRSQHLKSATGEDLIRRLASCAGGRSSRSSLTGGSTMDDSVYTPAHTSGHPPSSTPPGNRSQRSLQHTLYTNNPHYGDGPMQFSSARSLAAPELLRAGSRHNVDAQSIDTERNSDEQYQQKDIDAMESNGTRMQGADAAKGSPRVGCCGIGSLIGSCCNCAR
jgi:hypothetical protein